VPGTRVLRQLPMETPVSERNGARVRSSGLSLGFRLILGSLLLLGSSCLLYGGWLAYERWNAPIEFGHSEEEIYKNVYNETMQEPIVRNWEHWNYLVDLGISDNPEVLPYFAYSRYYEAQKPWMVGSLVTGAIAVAAFIGLSFLGFRRVAG